MDFIALYSQMISKCSCSFQTNSIEHVFTILLETLSLKPEESRFPFAGINQHNSSKRCQRTETYSTFPVPSTSSLGSNRYEVVVNHMGMRLARIPGIFNYHAQWLQRARTMHSWLCRYVPVRDGTCAGWAESLPPLPSRLQDPLSPLKP